MSDPFARIILTRPSAASEQFLQHISAELPMGVEVIQSPLLEIVPTGQVPQYADTAGVIFTSSNGVLHGSNPANCPAFCLGDATTKAAKAAGWYAQFTGNTSQELVQTLISDNVPGPLLHIGGRHRRGEVAQKLSNAGFETTVVDVYDQQLLSLSETALTALNGDIPVIVPLFSPRTARQFAQEHSGKGTLHVVAISEAVLEETKYLKAASRHIAALPNALDVWKTLRNLLHRVETRDTAQ